VDSQQLNLSVHSAVNQFVLRASADDKRPAGLEAGCIKPTAERRPESLWGISSDATVPVLFYKLSDTPL
jgi:hypothetical protein